MSMLGAVAEVMMIDAAVSAARGNPGQQRNNYSPLRMLGAVICFEALDALAGPVVGALGAAALMNGSKADAQPATANNAATQQPRAQKRQQPSLGMNLAPGAPTM